MISDERADGAVEFLRDNARKHGALKAAVLLAEYKVKRARALAFLEADGTVAEREAKAWASEVVKDACEEHANLTADETVMRDHIEAATLTFEKWRTEQANQRRGVV